jgi:hypothetical protein
VLTCAVPRRLLPRESATRAFAELLTYCEEDRTLRAVLVGMLREAAKVHLGSWAHREPTSRLP